MSSGRIPDGPPRFAPKTFAKWFGTCQCDDAYKSRRMTDPSCRRCEHQEDWYWMVTQALDEAMVDAQHHEERS